MSVDALRFNFFRIWAKKNIFDPHKKHLTQILTFVNDQFLFDYFSFNLDKLLGKVPHCLRVVLTENVHRVCKNI